MQLTGEWIVPKTHGENYYNKPPLYNWVLLGVAKMLGGFSELSVRLPGLLSFLLLAVGIFYVAKKYLNKKVAILATLGFLANPEMLFYGTLVSGEIDLFFSLLIFWQVVVLFHCLEKGRDLKAFAISYLLAGVGMLTKGLPALAFQGLTIVAWLLVSKRPEKLFSWQHIVGGLVFFVPTVLYAYAYVQKEPLTPFLINLFMESAQQTPVEKTTGQTVGTFLRFPGQLLVMFMPFSLLLIPLAIRVKKVKAVLRNYRWLLFCQVFIIANIWLYWISPGNESRYLYPFYPFVCYGTGQTE